MPRGRGKGVKGAGQCESEEEGRAVATPRGLLPPRTQAPPLPGRRLCTPWSQQQQAGQVHFRRSQGQLHDARWPGCLSPCAAAADGATPGDQGLLAPGGHDEGGAHERARQAYVRSNPVHAAVCQRRCPCTRCAGHTAGFRREQRRSGRRRAAFEAAARQVVGGRKKAAAGRVEAGFIGGWKHDAVYEHAAARQPAVQQWQRRCWAVAGEGARGRGGSRRERRERRRDERLPRRVAAARGAWRNDESVVSSAVLVGEERGKYQRHSRALRKMFSGSSPLQGAWRRRAPIPRAAADGREAHRHLHRANCLAALRLEHK
jgi:hypothetical protein